MDTYILRIHVRMETNKRRGGDLLDLGRTVMIWNLAALLRAVSTMISNRWYLCMQMYLYC